MYAKSAAAPLTLTRSVLMSQLNKYLKEVQAYSFRTCVELDQSLDQLKLPPVLKKLALLPPDSTGYGIPSGVTLRIDSNGRAEALGGPIHRFHRGLKHVRRIADLQPLRPAQAPAGGPA